MNSDPRKDEGAGNAGCRTHPNVLRANGRKHARKSSQVRRTVRHQWVTAYTRSPRSAGLLASVVGRVTCKLDPSIGGSGPHDFAVRWPITRQLMCQRPSHPAPTFVTIAKRPSCGCGTRKGSQRICRSQSGIFFVPGLDDPNQLDRAYEIDFLAQQISAA